MKTRCLSNKEIKDHLMATLMDQGKEENFTHLKQCPDCDKRAKKIWRSIRMDYFTKKVKTGLGTLDPLGFNPRRN